MSRKSRVKIPRVYLNIMFKSELVCVHGKTRVQHCVSSSLVFYLYVEFFWERISHWKWNSPLGYTDQPVSPQNPLVSCSRFGITARANTLFVKWILQSGLRVSCLHTSILPLKPSLQPLDWATYEQTDSVMKAICYSLEYRTQLCVEQARVCILSTQEAETGRLPQSQPGDTYRRQ